MIELKTPEDFRREFAQRYTAEAKSKAYYTHVAKQCPDDALWGQYMIGELDEDDPPYQVIEEWVKLWDQAAASLYVDLNRMSELYESVFHSDFDLSEIGGIIHEEKSRIDNEVAQLDPSDL